VLRGDIGWKVGSTVGYDCDAHERAPMIEELHKLAPDWQMLGEKHRAILARM
jgi:hypothetical protein